MQETDFKFEILIHDDASTDGTTAIIREYETKYPDIVKPLYEKENQWVLGRRGSAVFNFPRAQGRYIALCEGDDYWTDPLKLQKQVDFLEAHREYSMCFHEVLLCFEDNSQRTRPFHENRTMNQRYTLSDLFDGNIINTCSVVFRNRLFMDYPTWALTSPCGDWPLFMLISQYGDIFYMNDVMAVYRIHKGGIWRNCYDWNSARRKKADLQKITTLRKAAKTFDVRYTDALYLTIAGKFMCLYNGNRTRRTFSTSRLIYFLFMHLRYCSFRLWAVRLDCILLYKLLRDKLAFDY